MSTTGEIESTDTSTYNQLAGDESLTTTSSERVMTQEPVFLKVAVLATAASVRVSFDPVSVEQVRQTRELNRSVRLGFVRPTASTR